MKIQLELDALNTCLEMITRLAPPTSGNVAFHSDGKKVKLVSSADLSRCTAILPCTVDKAGEFAIPLQALKDATKGRKELELVYKNATLTVVSGKYKAELSTVDVIPLDEHEPEEGTEIKISTDQSAWLKKALRDVSLKPTAMLSAWMPAGIKMGPKSSFVACYDTQHMSWVTSKEVTGDFECVLPIETLINVLDLFHKTPFVMRQTKTRVEIKTKLAHVFLNIPTMDDLPALPEVMSKVKEASKVTGATFTFAKEPLGVFMDNARAVMGKERAEIQVTAGAKGLTAAIKTGQGAVETSIKGSGKGSFKIDYEYLQEGLAKAGSEIEMNVVHEAFLSIKLSTSSIIIALNQ